MNVKPNPCRYCRGIPRVIVAPGDLFYTQCKCTKWNPYEFLGTSKKASVENWNMFNPPIKEEE